MIEFAAVVERARLLDPAGNPSEQTIEHRKDPLTGTVASINAALGEKAKAFLGAADLDLLRQTEEKSRQGCPFCSASEKGTRFARDFAPEGQIRTGSALAVPNLFSKCTVDAVVIVDPARHVLFPSQLDAKALADAIRASAAMVRRARAYDGALVHHVAGMNFLNPGGSSVPHPHLQIHVRSVPYSAVSRLDELSAAFHARTGGRYWDVLLDAERRAGVRYVAATGDVQWVAAYAPAHQKEIWGILPGTASLASLGDRDAEGFASGIAKTVSFYEESGTHPFTFAFFSHPNPDADRHFALHVKLCARPAFRALYSNYDTWFTPKFLGDDVHTEAPEQYAARLRSRF
jgi:UDPglucose--hexose-1-phosphate uridylyltransferase